MRRSQPAVPGLHQPALYQHLCIDGYLLDCVSSKELPEDKNEIILSQEGTWKPIPREEASVDDKKRQEETDGCTLIYTCNGGLRTINI